MVDSKFFGIPFAVSGDKATIPEDTQPSGAISYQQGYGPDYERDPATDPLAKRVPRDETNEIYYQITNAMRFLQLYGAPEWYAVDGNGDPVSYPVTARVRHDAGVGMQVWRSLIANNTTTPGANPAHWTLDDPYSTAALEASLAESLAGTIGTKLITPRRMASSVQRGAWNYAVAAGTAGAITASITPGIVALLEGQPVLLKLAFDIAAGATLDLNGLGAAPIVYENGSPVRQGDYLAGALLPVGFDGTSWQIQGQRNGAPKLNYFEMVTGRTQIVPTSTVTRVNDFTLLGSEPGDAVFSNGGIVTIGPKTAGVWLCSQYYAPNQTGGAAATVQSYLFKNSTTKQVVTVSGSFCSQTAVVRVIDGDQLDMRVWQNSGGGRTNFWPSATPPDTTFSMYQISS